MSALTKPALDIESGLAQFGFDRFRPGQRDAVETLIRPIAQARAQAVAVVPHGCGVYGYYMAMAFDNINLAEFMMMSERADTIEPNFGTLFQNEPLPEGGYITLPDTPGFGLELNRDALHLVRPYTH